MKLKYCFILFFAASWLSQVSAQLDFDAVEKQRMARARVRTQTEWVHDYVNGRPAPRGYRSAVTRYDTRGNIVEIINYNEAGRVLSSNVFQYNSADNRVNFEQFDADRKLRYSQKAVYDSRGNKTREFGFDGAKPYNNIFTYDANGRLIEITYTEEEIVVERRRMTYSGNRTEISVLNPSGSLMFRIVNTHNDRGQLLSEVRTNAQGVVATQLNHAIQRRRQPHPRGEKTRKRPLGLSKDIYIRQGKSSDKNRSRQSGRHKVCCKRVSIQPYWRFDNGIIEKKRKSHRAVNQKNYL